MVIISKDDYLSFLNEVGVRMQTPPVNVNNQLSTVSTTTIVKRSDSNSSQITVVPQLQPPLPQAQTHLQQLQQQATLACTQQLNATNGSGNNKAPQVARAILVCRPNSHPFQNRTLYLEPNVETKIGRSVARNKVSETNAIFDCKVLSRNHAVLWYSDGKFFLKDTGSSNGTFINNQRLSQTTTESEPFEVSSGDIVQFGVDVMENSRKETHGCIVATLKLFLPDGRETKASQSTLVGAICTKIEPSDLYRLNQYVQEIVQRDQIMESKLLNIQKTVDTTRKNSSASWQALIDEDRLLSRIDMLEKKLQCLQKNVTEDKIREEVLKLHEEKLVYQNSAKEALRKVYQERSDAIQRLTTIQRALCSSEDECSILREQITKLNQQIQELTEKLETIQNQFDEKISEATQKETDKNIEIKGLKEDLSMLQGRIELLQNNYISDEEEQHDTNISSSSIEKLSSLFMKSNIKNMKDSFDIINAICNDNELESNEDSTQLLDNATLKIYKKILNLESIITLIEESESKKTAVTKNDSNVTAENIEESSTNQNQSVCDGNQNLSSAAIVAASTDVKLMKKAIKNLKNSFIDFMKECDTKLEQGSGSGSIKDAEQAEEFETQIKTLKQELESRPSAEDYKEKSELIDELNDKLTLSETENLAFKLELTNNKTKLETLQKQLKNEKEKSVSSDPILSQQCETTDAIAQTDLVNLSETSTNTSITEATSLPPQIEHKISPSVHFDNKSEPVPSSYKPSGVEDLTNESRKDTSDSSHIDAELKIIHHPDVQREEELVIFKEKYTKLVEEKLKLDQELLQLREDYHQYRNKSIIQLIMYLAPVIAVISYLFLYFTK